MANSGRRALSLLFCALLVFSAAAPVYGVSGPPVAPQNLQVQVDVLSVGTGSVIARFTTSAEYNSNVTSVTIVSSTPKTGSSGLISNPVVFDHWDESQGLLSAVKLQRILIQNESSGFPFEDIDLQLWVGSNLTLTPTLVSASLPTYIVSETFTVEKLAQLTPEQASAPGISSLFASYAHVGVAEVKIYHSLYFQFFALISTLMPVFVIALAVIVVYLSIYKKPRSQSNTDYVSVLVGLFLFLPIFSFSIGQLIPSAQSEFVANWLSLIGTLTAASFLVVLGSILAVIVERG